MNKDVPPNTQLSHYRIVSKLGSGGMGEVYLAEDTRLGRKVALKLLPTELTKDPDRVRRFIQEAKAASALNHPNIITIHDIGESEFGHFLVMELVSGRPVSAFILKNNSVETLLALGSQMARALSAAHAAGITHRDIKPDNIMVRDDGYVKVLDFGLARLLPTSSSEDAATLAQQTTPGMIMGTVAYMSPEQASGQSVGAPSDIFALGIVLYEIATGQHPFRAETLVGYLHAITLQSPPPPSRLKSRIPTTLDELILRMLEKEAGRRPTASEIAVAFQVMERRGDATNELELESETVLLPSGQVNRESTAVPKDRSGTTSSDDGFWVAVLPFKSPSANADLEALAEGLSEDIVTGLSRFSYLRVIARSSTLRFSSEASDIRNIGKELGARYVMEGNLRQAGSMLRVTVQLVDSSSGAHLWAETYDRPFLADQIFAIQDDLVPRIVSTVADAYGVLPHSMSQALRNKDANQLTSYEALLRSFSYLERVTAEEHTKAKAALERAVEQSPGDSDCWAMLSILHTDEYIHGFSEGTGLLEQALQLARIAVDANPLNHRAYQAVAWALCYRKEFDACRHAAERTVALNPMDASAMAYVGQTIAYAGGWERGCELLNRAMQLNPHHPGWYRYAGFLNAYRQADFVGALDIALRMNMPGVSLMYVALAAVYGQLDELQPAREAVRELLALRPDFKVTARAELEKLWDSKIVDSLIDGLRKAGLEIDGGVGRSEPSPPPSASGESRADEGFWVAVLPFKSAGADAGVTALAEGLSEDITSGLSRFSYLRVIARGSTLRYGNQATDTRAAGKELGARYVIDGSLRQAGSMLRIAVQVVDASTGAHLWAETYNRTFSPEALFELQDDLVPRIVSTVADWYGVLPHSMSEVVRLKAPDQLTPYEAVLRSFGYFERIVPEEHAAVRAGLERAVEQSPGNADGWAMLSMMYGEEHRFGFNVEPDPLARSLEAARRAVDAAHGNHFAWLALAQALFFRKEFDTFRHAAERAIALNPMDGSTLEYVGHLIAFYGDWERGCEVAERARQLNPNHPGWYWALPFLDAYRKGDYQNARTFLLKSNQPGHFFVQALLAAVYGQLGEREAAQKAVRTVLTLKPDFAMTGRDDFAKWYLPELVEQLMDGLGKAGLAVVGAEGTAPPRLAADSSRTGASPVATEDTQTANEATTSPTQSIAILPFANLSTDEENEYFCDGLAEELLNALAKIGELNVAARSSAFSFKGKNAEAREIGKTLNVNTVLEGSVRKSGNRIRITVQLVNAANGYHLWSERYDRHMKDIFDVQDEITLSVVDALKLKLLGAEKAGIFDSKPNSAEALDLYLKGRFHFQLHTREGFERAVEYFQKAIEDDSSYALAFAGLSSVSIFRWFFGFVSAEEVLPKARSAALRALELSRNLDEGHIALAHIHMFYEWDLEEAEQEYREAIRLNPKNAYAHYQYGLCLAVMEKPEQAILEAEKAIELEPLSVLANFQVAAIYFHVGLLEESSRYGQRLIEMAPDFYGGYFFKGAALLAQGEFFAAIRQLERSLTLDKEQDITKSFLGQACGLAGDKSRALELSRELQDQRDKRCVNAFYIARIHSSLRDVEETLAWLERAYEERNGELVYLKLYANQGRGKLWGKEISSDKRFQDLLKRLGFSTEEADKPKLGAPSIAVLPFDNISTEADNEYFCDGLAEELINALSKIESLRVAARTSAFSFKGKQTDIREIGRKLNVATVLEGSVRKSGNRLRITVQLVSIDDGYHLWSERYDREMEDIFDVQDEIALTVVEALRMKLLGQEKAAVLKHYTDNTEAYQLYLKGRYHANRFTREGFNKAIEYLKKAIEIDSSYASAYAGIADAYYHAATIHMPPGEAFLRVKAASVKALELDDELAEAHTMLALFISHYERKPLQAESGFKRGIELAPNNVLTHQWYGLYLMLVGRFDEAIAELRRAQQLDPLSLIIGFLLGWTFYFARKPERAIEEARRALEIDDNFWMAHWTMALAYEQTGQYDNALAELEKAKTLDDSSWIPAIFARVYGRVGRKDEAQKILDELAESSKQKWVAPYLMATAYLSLNRQDQAFEWLQKALDQYDEWIDCLQIDPALDELRSDPRFEDLLRQM